MKQLPQLDEVQRRMAPGVITRDGFLGTDVRKLVDILEADDAEVHRLDLSHELIAVTMQRFRDAGEAGLGDYITVEPHFEVRVDSVRGRLPSPFGGKGTWPKTNITVRNLELGEEVVYTDLSIHMIRDYGFYEGKGAPFRLDPVRLVRILEIKPLARPAIP